MSDVGWRILPHDDAVAAWAEHAKGSARKAMTDPKNAHWLRCNGTWFAGVDCLPNDETGRLKGGPVLPAKIFDTLPCLPLHRAQVSAIFPGYPQPMEGESEAAASYRLNRDAAHVDGLLPEGPSRRRHLREPHAYILGLPLTDSPADASPLVVWEGSHKIMAEAFKAAFAGRDPSEWPEVDVTETYHAARRKCFETCQRVEMHARRGQTILLHRLSLHGMAPWRSTAQAPRIVAYFRPEGDLTGWPTV